MHENESFENERTDVQSPNPQEVPSDEKNDSLVDANKEDAQVEATSDSSNGKKKKSVKREIFEWVLCILGAVAIALVIRTFLFEFVRVDGRSMAETLQDGERMFVTKLDYWVGEPERFDVVICHYPERGLTDFVKRVVGLPGDTVAMLNGTLILNGKQVDEPYITHKANYNMSPYTLKDGEYFVLGDNRANSNDSHIIGPLSRNMIRGHVRHVIFPFNVIREINGDDAIVAE